MDLRLQFLMKIELKHKISRNLKNNETVESQPMEARIIAIKSISLCLLVNWTHYAQVCALCSSPD